MACIRRYACPAQLAPVVEAALAAEGYRPEIPYQENIRGDGMVVMTHGAVSVLLTQSARDDWCELAIWGDAQHAATLLLESLPIAFERLPSIQANN